MAESRADTTKSYEEAISLLSRKGASPAESGKAILLLQNIRATGETSPQLEANLARAYFRLENYPKAIEHFELAIRYDRWNSQYRKDLVLAQEKNPGNLATGIEHPAEWGAYASSYLRPQEALFFSSLLLFAFLAYSILIKPFKKSTWIVGSLFFVFAFGISALSFTGSSIAIVTSSKDVSVKSAPLESAEEVILLKPGSRLRTLNESGKFTEVERPNVLRGWIATESITSIQDIK